MIHNKFIVSLVSVFMMGLSSYAQTLVTYPAPAGFIYTQHNDDYTVMVRQEGGEWQDLFEYTVKVDLDDPQDAAMVYFDFEGKVEISIRKNNGNFREVTVRPSSFGLPVKIVGRTAFFTLSKPQKLSVEFDGDKLHNLHVFANPPEPDRPDPNDPNVIYFGPGVHQPGDLPGDEFNIPSGKTVYIAGGAVVKAKLVCDRVENVKIRGRGILFQPMRGIEIRHSSDVEIDGIIVVNPKHYTVYAGGSKNIIIRNLKSFSANGWSDGIDMMSCSDVFISDIFMRNSDDCIAVYGHRWDFYGDSRNIKVSNAILWADIAHPIQIGIHGNTRDSGDLIENIVFDQVDILEHDEDDPNYQGCMSINAGDLNTIRNVTFRNVRVDDFQEGQLLNLRVVYNEKYNTGPGKSIENILFENIEYNGLNLAPSVVGGLDEKHRINGITFKNVRINNKLILNPREGNIRVGPFVSGVTFER